MTYSESCLRDDCGNQGAALCIGAENQPAPHILSQTGQRLHPLAETPLILGPLRDKHHDSRHSIDRDVAARKHHHQPRVLQQLFNLRPEEGVDDVRLAVHSQHEGVDFTFVDSVQHTRNCIEVVSLDSVDWCVGSCGRRGGQRERVGSHLLGSACVVVAHMDGKHPVGTVSALAAAHQQRQLGKRGCSDGIGDGHQNPVDKR